MYYDSSIYALVQRKKKKIAGVKPTDTKKAPGFDLITGEILKQLSKNSFKLT